MVSSKGFEADETGNTSGPLSVPKVVVIKPTKEPSTLSVSALPKVASKPRTEKRASTEVGHLPAPAKDMCEEMFSWASQLSNALPKMMLLCHHCCFQPAACCCVWCQGPFGYMWRCIARLAGTTPEMRKLSLEQGLRAENHARSVPANKKVKHLFGTPGFSSLGKQEHIPSPPTPACEHK